MLVNVLRVKRRRRPRALHLFQRDARVFQPTSIDKISGSIRQTGPGQRRNGFNQNPQPVVRLLEFVDHLLQLSVEEFALLQRSGLSGETPIYQRADRDETEDQQGYGTDPCDAEWRDMHSMRQIWWHHRVSEAGGSHAGVMHGGDAGPHHHGACTFLRPTRFGVLPKMKREPKCYK